MPTNNDIPWYEKAWNNLVNGVNSMGGNGPYTFGGGNGTETGLLLNDSLKAGSKTPKNKPGDTLGTLNNMYQSGALDNVTVPTVGDIPYNTAAMTPAQIAAHNALMARKRLQEKYNQVSWDMPTPQGWQTGVTGPYGPVSGVGLQGDPMQDAAIFKQIAYLPSSAAVRKALGVYSGPANYAGDGSGGGGGGGGGSGYLSYKGPGGRGGGGGGGGNMGYPKNGLYKQPQNLPRWINNLVAWRM